MYETCMPVFEEGLRIPAMGCTNVGNVRPGGNERRGIVLSLYSSDNPLPVSRLPHCMVSSICYYTRGQVFCPHSCSRHVHKFFGSLRFCTVRSRWYCAQRGSPVPRDLCVDSLNGRMLKAAGCGGRCCSYSTGVECSSSTSRSTKVPPSADCFTAGVLYSPGSTS